MSVKTDIILARLMRHLAAVGYLKELAPDTYERTHFTKALSVPMIGETYPVVLVSSIRQNIVCY